MRRTISPTTTSSRRGTSSPTAAYERYSPEDVQKLKDTQQRIKVELLRKLGYHGIVYHNAAGQVVYWPLDEGEQPNGVPRQPPSPDHDLEPFTKAYYQQVERYRREGPACTRSRSPTCNPGQADGRGRRPGHQQALRQ